MVPGPTIKSARGPYIRGWEMKLIHIMLLLAFSTAALADTYVNGYYRKDGTYVQGHTRSSPNNTRYDNYGSPSSSQRSSSYPSTYTRDSDGDGVSNQYDMDDNNNGVMDDSER